MKLYPSKKQWRNWTLPSKAGDIATVITIISVLLWLFSYMTSATKENQKEMIRGQEEILEEVRELKNATIQGDKILVEQIDKQIHKERKWDFKTGSTGILLSKGYFFNDRELKLLSIISKDIDASIKFHKDSNDYIHIVYTYPTIGEITRGTQLTFDDFTDIQAVFIVFTWDLEEARTTLYINGRERK